MLQSREGASEQVSTLPKAGIALRVGMAWCADQRARKQACVKAIHTKIKAWRKDAWDRLSTRLVRDYGAIFIGRINGVGLAKTNMAN